MMTTTPFRLVYAVQVKIHLKAIDRKYHSVIRQEIENQLRFEPDVETRNRKPLTRAVEFGQSGNCVVGQIIGFGCFMKSIKLNERLT